MSFKHFNLGEIARVLKVEAVPVAYAERKIEKLSTDSRKIVNPAETLFFAIRSPKNDGHRYVADLVKQGVRSFVVEVLPEGSWPEDVVFLLVKKSLSALQTLAMEHRTRFSIPVVGITGSNGKTMVKEWLSLLLNRSYKVVCNPKSYNSQIGVPLSVWEMDARHEIALFEAGISEPGEMEHLHKIIRPTIGIFTTIGHAHDEHFLNLDQKIGEKLRLFTQVETLIFCLDHVEIRSRVLALESFKEIRLFTWSMQSAEANLFVEQLDYREHSVVLTAIYEGHRRTLEFPFTDSASIENLMHCWALTLVLGMEHALVSEAMQKLTPLEMRLELKEGIQHCSVINDSYSSDTSSLLIALDFLAQQNQHPRKTVILSDMLHSGRSESELYGEIAQLLQEKKVERIIGIGPSISAQAALFSGEKEFYPDTNSFLKQFDFSSLHNETILLKGARIFTFEKINRILQQKSHQTVLEIDLNAMQHNLNYYRSCLHPGTRVMAMVKAFSYGSGSYEISNFLQFNQVDYLTVAYADEGVELRNSGIALPIMVMNPEESAFGKMLQFDLEPEIYSFRTLSFLKEELALNPHPVNIHLKIDSGMHRLGFMSQDIDLLLEELSREPLIRVRSVFSHLAGSDNPDLDSFTQEQLRRFLAMGRRLQTSLPEPILLHILNSAGITRFPEAQFDMVRLGIGLYGVGYNEQEQEQLQAVSTLKATLSQIKDISAGESIGYNRNYRLEEKRRIGVITIGYADGLSRRMGNGRGVVWLNGQRVPIVGNVCMDMCMLDITGVEAHEGDVVEIFGPHIPIDEVAQHCETIPYEILTGISRRVKRIYYQE